MLVTVPTRVLAPATDKVLDALTAARFDVPATFKSFPRYVLSSTARPPFVWMLAAAVAAVASLGLAMSMVSVSLSVVSPATVKAPPDAIVAEVVLMPPVPVARMAPAPVDSIFPVTVVNPPVAVSNPVAVVVPDRVVAPVTASDELNVVAPPTVSVALPDMATLPVAVTDVSVEAPPTLSTPPMNAWRATASPPVVRILAVAVAAVAGGTSATVNTLFKVVAPVTVSVPAEDMLPDPVVLMSPLPVV